MLKFLAAAFAVLFAVPVWANEAPVEGATGYIAMTALCDKYEQIEAILEAGQESEDKAKVEYFKLFATPGEYEGSPACVFIPQTGYVPVMFIVTVGSVDNVHLFGQLREKVYIIAVMWDGAQGSYPGYFFALQPLRRPGEPA